MRQNGTFFRSMHLNMAFVAGFKLKNSAENHLHFD